MIHGLDVHGFADSSACEKGSDYETQSTAGLDGRALCTERQKSGGDVGYYPDWVNNTRAYLNDRANTRVNVILWSWCGQVSGKYSCNKLLTEYIEPMSQLEKEYPNVTFIYMTGHTDHADDANNKRESLHAQKRRGARNRKQMPESVSGIPSLCRRASA